MFQVTGIWRGLIRNAVEVTALKEITGSKPLLVRRGLGLVQCPYRFPKGTKLTIYVPRWKRLKAGDFVDVSTVLRDGLVQKMISRGDPNAFATTTGS